MVTVAIIDFAHSGTTMVAGICEILGVPMVLGDHHRIKWEDHSVIEAIQQGEGAFAALVERRSHLAAWGFKYPGAWKFPEALAHLRNPVYLAIYKDPVSVTRRRFGTSEDRAMKKLRNTMRQMMKSINALYYTFGQPVHVLSYQKAIIAPEAFVREIAIAIGLDGGNALINKAAEYIQPNTGGPRKRYPEIESWI